MAEYMLRAQQDLVQHRLTEAESIFHSVLTNMTTEQNDKEQHIMQSLSGLAEIYLKRSRSMRHDVHQWHCMYLVSMGMYRLLAQYCDIISSMEHEDELQSYITEYHSKAARFAHVMEEKLVKSLEDHVCPSNKTGKRTTTSLDLDWLTTLHVFCLTKVKEISQLADTKLCATDGHSSRDSDISSLDDRSNTDFDEFEDGNRVKTTHQIDFKRVQKAIMKLVRQVSTEVRGRYVREHVPEAMLRESVTAEMVCRMSPETNTTDIAELFEQAFLKNAHAHHAIEDARDPTPVIEEPLKVDQTWSYSLSKETKRKLYKEGPKKWQWDSVESEAELMEITAENGDAVHSFPGILTVWKAYKKVHSSEVNGKGTPNKLKIFEEMSSLTELGEHLKDEEMTSNASSENSSLIYQASPMNMDTFNVTLAHVLRRLGDKMMAEAEYNLASDLFKYSLGIYEDTGMKLREFGNIADMLKNLGIIKCQQADLSAGINILEEAIAMYERRDKGEINLDMARVWLEMGKAYMAENGHDGALFHHVMDMVKVDYEGHVKEELIYAEDDDSDSECSQGESYPLSLCEAIDCLNHAMGIIRKLRKRHHNVDESLYVDVLTRLADCSIMTGVFDRAVACYEEALSLFRNAQESTALPNNAHVLTMMGIANFFLGNFPKAITMFDTAHILHQHLCSSEPSFEMAFTLTLLGIAYHLQKQYHRSIAWCSKAYEIYTYLYGSSLHSLGSLHHWFVVQTLYILGYSYCSLDFFEKSMYYINICEEMIERVEEEERDVKLMVKVLKVKADIYSMVEDQENGLFYYQKALEYSQSLGDEKSATALQNHLLNCMAGLHVGSKQYATAAMYLEQALGHQKNMTSSIRGDMVDILSQLGLTYSLSGDLDKAIECYKDCTDAIKEGVASPSAYHAGIYGSLATLYHVKACMQDDNNDLIEYLDNADMAYQSALSLDHLSVVAIQYANFLQQQGRAADALEKLLPFVFGNLKRNSPDVLYHGVQQAILPEHFQHELEDIDELHLGSWIYATFIALLCYKELGLLQDAEDCLLILYKLAGDSNVTINQTMLGYALMEMNMYADAAKVFLCSRAQNTDDEWSPALVNMWLSLCAGAYASVALGGYLCLCDVLSQQRTALMKQQAEEAKQQVAVLKSARDSGYDDSALDLANNAKIQLCMRRGNSVSSDVSYTENTETIQATEDNAEEGIWITEEGVMETPVALLQQEEGWVTEEGVMETPTELQKDEEWVTVEGLMETPTELLQEEEEWVTEEWQEEFQAQQQDNSDMLWTIEEETLNGESPTGVAPAFTDSKARNALMEQDEIVLRPDVIVEEDGDVRSDDGDSDEWHIEEVVVETSPEILAMLHRQQQAEVNGATSSQGSEEWTTTYTEEMHTVTEESTTHQVKALEDDEELWEVSGETVETPAAILELLRNSYNNGVDSIDEQNGNDGLQHDSFDYCERVIVKREMSPPNHVKVDNAHLGERNYEVDFSESSEVVEDSVSMEQVNNGDQGSDGEETWETWEVEETVETPPEVLLAILASQNQ